MKRTLNFAVAAIAAFSATAHAQRDYLVGLPNQIDMATRDVIAASVVDLIGRAEAGDRFVIMDGQELRRVVAFTRPEARSGRSLSRRLRAEFAILGQYLEGAVAEPTPEITLNAVRHPQVLSTMGAVRLPDREARIVLFGSAFYSHPSDPSFAMGGGMYPSDAHLAAAPELSIYTVKGKESSLEGCGVYFCYLEEAFVNSFERAANRRWWTLFVAGHGATLAHISASAPDTVEAALRGSERPAIEASVDPRDDKVEMRRAGATVPAAPHSRLEAVAARIAPPERGKFTVAAFWPVGRGARVDVDIYLRARPGAEEICFRRKKTRDGRLLRDVQGGSDDGDHENWRASWEVVEVNETAFGESEAWLNLYAYQGPGPIEGVVRVAIETRFVDLPFRFDEGVQGNRGASSKARGISSQWVKVDLDGAFEALESQR